MLQNIMLPIPQLSVNTASMLNADFLFFLNAAGTATPLQQPCAYVTISNNSNIAVNISFDNGVTTHATIIAGQQLPLPFQQNAQPNGDVALLAKGTSIKASRVGNAAGVGFVYLSGWYQPQRIS